MLSFISRSETARLNASRSGNDHDESTRPQAVEILNDAYYN